ncbi:MAG: prephenate dehydrogenase [Gammaproteobacteria bacterium]
MIETLCIVGVGLIGGSLAKDLRRHGAVANVVGCSRSEEHLARARELRVIDRFDTDVSAAVRGADMVVLAVPLGAMQSVFEKIGPALTPGAVVTDVGSAKVSVINAARAAFGQVPPWLVPGHPIAGNENSGVEAAMDNLYLGRRVILTPTPTSEEQAVARVRAMWECVGAEVLTMQPEHHDEVLAATSHLPHMLAYTLVDVLGQMEDRVEIFRYAAGGFRDFTRIASSDPQMWHDICMANKDALAEVLDSFGNDLQALLAAVRRGDGTYLHDLFTRAKSLRDRHTKDSGE